MRRRSLNLRKALLKLILPLLRRLPPRRASSWLSGIGRVEYALSPGLRLRFDAAVARGACHFGASWDPRTLGPALAGNHVVARTRDLLLDTLPDSVVSPLIAVTGREGLDAALAEGKGVILLFCHFGQYLLPAHWLFREGYALRWFTERPRHLSRFLTQHLDSDGPLGQRDLFISRRATSADGAAAIRRATKVLRAGMILKVGCDVRWSGPRTAEARFLGQTYSFTTTWVSLAATTGAAVVPAFGRLIEDGSYAVEFLPPFRVPCEAARGDSEAASPWVQRCLDGLEERVRRHPADSNDYFFWSEDLEAVGPTV